MLNDLKKDFLIEFFNANIKNTADILSETVNQRVILSFSELEMEKLNSSESNLELSQHNYQQCVLATMKFFDSFSGSIFIIFSCDDVKSLVCVCAEPNKTNPNLKHEKITPMDLDAIKEISNIVFNGVVGELARLIEKTPEYSNVQVQHAVQNELESMIPPEDKYFLEMSATFIIPNNRFDELLYIELSTESAQMLINKIDDMLGDMNE